MISPRPTARSKFQLPTLKAQPLSAGYRQWRRQFLLERIPWACGLGMGLQLIFLAIALLIELPLQQRTIEGATALTPAHYWLPIWEASLGIAMLTLIWLLAQLPKFRRAPQRLILLFPLALLIVPELPDLLFLTPRSFHLNLLALIVFVYQAILLPVYWRQHLIAQTIALSTLPLSFVWIFSTQWQEIQLKAQTEAGLISGNFAELFSILSIQLLMAAIALLIVWLQERFFVREYELRDRLQLFLHAISHDLRPPAMGTIMLLQQIRDQQGEAEITGAMLEQMLASGDRQLRLIDSLTAAHRTEAQLQLQLESVSLHGLISSLLQEMRPLLEESQATVQLLISRDVPAVQADPLQLRRVYENLLSNALQYNAAGLRLELDAELREGQLYCTVCDDGRGMTQEQCEQLFDRYSRALNARHPLHLGLGLYICRQIIEAHGGTIDVASESGIGTTFKFILALEDV